MSTNIAQPTTVLSSTPVKNSSEKKQLPLVSVLMGSDSDLAIMQSACTILNHFGVPYECCLLSAHRTPHKMYEFANSVEDRGIKVIIAGAGGAAHVPGMLAALCLIPVIGVPIKTSALGGLDSLYSIVQMPRGIPVATVGISNSTNAALLAVRMLAISQPRLRTALKEYHKVQAKGTLEKSRKLVQLGYGAYLQQMKKK